MFLYVPLSYFIIFYVFLCSFIILYYLLCFSMFLYHTLLSLIIIYLLLPFYITLYLHLSFFTLLYFPLSSFISFILLSIILCYLTLFSLVSSNLIFLSILISFKIKFDHPLIFKCLKNNSLSNIPFHDTLSPTSKTIPIPFSIPQTIPTYLEPFLLSITLYILTRSRNSTPPALSLLFAQSVG